jgi:hypothetical protein
MLPRRRYALGKGGISGAKIVERDPNYRFWTDKAEEAA